MIVAYRTVNLNGSYIGNKKPSVFRHFLLYLSTAIFHDKAFQSVYSHQLSSDCYKLSKKIMNTLFQQKKNRNKKSFFSFI